jgi:hypothetical protein
MPLFIVRMLDLKEAQKITEIEVDAPNQYRAQTVAWDVLATKNTKEDPRVRYSIYGVVEKNV